MCRDCEYEWPSVVTAETSSPTKKPAALRSKKKKDTITREEPKKPKSPSRRYEHPTMEGVWIEFRVDITYGEIDKWSKSMNTSIITQLRTTLSMFMTDWGFADGDGIVLPVSDTTLSLLPVNLACWLNDTATEHIMSLNTHNVPIEMLSTYTIIEDTITRDGHVEEVSRYELKEHQSEELRASEAWMEFFRQQFAAQVKKDRAWGKRWQKKNHA